MCLACWRTKPASFPEDVSCDEVKKLHEEQVRKSQELIEDAEVVG